MLFDVKGSGSQIHPLSEKLLHAAETSNQFQVFSDERDVSLYVFYHQINNWLNLPVHTKVQAIVWIYVKGFIVHSRKQYVQVSAIIMWSRQMHPH